LKILLDTNVIIYSEDHGVLKKEIVQLNQLCEKHGIERCIHSRSRDDIERDKDPVRKKIILSKLSKYPESDFLESPDDEYRNKCGEPKKPNDETDDYILFALYKDAVHYLVTDDNGIHSKALKLGLEDRVFRVKEFAEFLDAEFTLNFAKIPSVQRLKLRDLDLSDPIFDSLRTDYDFDDWFKRKSTEGREAWVMLSGSKIVAICIFDPHNHEFDNQMKLCTFKVDDSFQGSKLGELLLRVALTFAAENRKDAVYVTIKKAKTFLINWFQDFGFETVADQYEKDEFTLKKTMASFLSIDVLATSEEKLNMSIKAFPRYMEPPIVNCYVIPIKPQYSEKLFPDIEDQLILPGLAEECGNAIKKAYVCQTKNRSFSKGDVVFFYESERKKALICFGFIEDFIVGNSANEILPFIGKRSVYSFADIEKMFAESNNPVVAIKFRYCNQLQYPVSLGTLEAHHILASHPQSIQSIKDYYGALKPLIP